MNERHMAYYQELAHAASEAFAQLLSAADCKDAVRQLIGNQISVEDLGLCDKTVSSLRRSGITTVDVLISYYDETWMHANSYLKEAAHQLEAYVRNLIAAVIPEKEQETEAEQSEPEIVMPTGRQPDERFIRCGNLDEMAEYFSQHDLPIEQLHLSARAYNVLKRSGIDSLSTLLTCTVGQMDQMRNLGEKSKQEIFLTVAAYLRSFRIVQNAAESEEVQEISLPADIKGSLLFANQEYRGRIIRMFGHKPLDLETCGFSGRAYNALAKKLGTETTAAQLLSLYADGLSQIRSIGSVTIQEIAVYIDRMLDEYTPQIVRCLNGEGEFPYTESEIQEKILSLYAGKTGFCGYSFQEFREKLPQQLTDDDIRANVSALLKTGELEYVDFRCYRVYPKFADFWSENAEVNNNYKEVLLGRMQGKSLVDIGNQMNVSRERVRQIETRALKSVHWYQERRLFDDDYYRYLYENYAIPKEAWLRYLKCPEETLWYLHTCCGKAGTAPAENALDDPLVTVNQKYRLQKYLDSLMLFVQDKAVPRERVQIEHCVFAHYCRDEMSFDEYIEIYNAVLRENGVPETDKLYYTAENKKSRGNRIMVLPYILWKQGSRLRYYDMDAQDFTELLETLNLFQYRNIELCTDKFTAEFPELMQKYDIRDGNELHIILKTIVKPEEHPESEIDFSRQPIIRFGTFDRAAAVTEIIAEHSPISADDLIAEVRSRFGYREGSIRGNILTALTQLYHDGYYSVDFKTIPQERLDAFRARLTEDYYEIEWLKKIYTEMFPGADPQEVNPRMMKTMGFTVHGNYLIQHFATAEEYFTYALTKDDTVDLEQLRKKFTAGYNTFSSILYRLLKSLEILYFEPNQLLNIRRLQKLGITKEMLTDYCDSAIGLVEDGQYFTAHYLRRNGFAHPLDALGLDAYFYNSLLLFDSRITGSSYFGGIVLYKGRPEQKHTRIDFVAYLLKGRTEISVSQLEQEARNLYGVDIGRDPYDLTRYIAEASDQLGMYFDRTMNKVYRDKSYYYADLERTETEESP